MRCEFLADVPRIKLDKRKKEKLHLNLYLLSPFLAAIPQILLVPLMFDIVVRNPVTMGNFSTVEFPFP